MVSEMDAFFNPSSVAIAGASKSTWKLGNVPIANMHRFEYQGRIVPLHPDGGEIMGHRAYKSLAEAGGDIEVALAAIPREVISSFVVECGRSGVRGVIVAQAGFADAGPDGTSLQREVELAARSHGLRMMGPNSIGTISTESGFVTSLMTLDRIAPGGVSIVAQTGLFAGGYARWLSSDQMCGLSKTACLGNKGDVDEIDMIRYLRDDRMTKVIAIYTEGIDSGRDFITAAVSAEQKPIIMLKGGSTEEGRSAAASHTGSLAGADRVYRGAFSQAGIIQVDSIRSLLDCAKAFDYCPLPAGNGVGIVSITGAGTVLAADACHEAGLTLPPLQADTVRSAGKGLPGWASLGNPADIWAAVVTRGMDIAYDAVLGAMSRQDDIDILIAILTLVPESEFDGAEVLRRIREDTPDKPLLACVMGASDEDYTRWLKSLETIGVPVFDSVEGSVTAAGALARHAYRLRNRESPGKE